MVGGCPLRNGPELLQEHQLRHWLTTMPGAGGAKQTAFSRRLGGHPSDRKAEMSPSALPIPVVDITNRSPYSLAEFKQDLGMTFLNSTLGCHSKTCSI